MTAIIIRVDRTIILLKEQRGLLFPALDFGFLCLKTLCMGDCRDSIVPTKRLYLRQLQAHDKAIVPDKKQIKSTCRASIGSGSTSVSTLLINNSFHPPVPPHLRPKKLASLSHHASLAHHPSRLYPRYLLRPGNEIGLARCRRCYAAWLEGSRRRYSCCWDLFVSLLAGDRYSGDCSVYSKSCCWGVNRGVGVRNHPYWREYSSGIRKLAENVLI